MVVKKIFIVHDNSYTKHQILDDMRAEGFRHKYKFFTDVPQEMHRLYLDEVDEVWVFGDVEDLEVYKLAILCGCDVWVMN